MYFGPHPQVSCWRSGQRRRVEGGGERYDICDGDSGTMTSPFARAGDVRARASAWTVTEHWKNLGNMMMNGNNLM